jgi:hypothetical protein
MRLLRCVLLASLVISGDCIAAKLQPAAIDVLSISQTTTISRSMSVLEKMALFSYVIGNDVAESRLVTYEDGRPPALYVRLHGQASYREFLLPEVAHVHRRKSASLLASR